MAISPAKLGAAHALARHLILAEVAGALTEAGVRFLLIKGPAVADWLYDDPGERPYGDIDLLVEPGCFEPAEDVLRRLGFRGEHAGLAEAERPDNAEHAHSYVRGTGDYIDLHRRPMLVAASAERAWAALTAGARPLRVGPATVDTLRPAAQLVVIALHAAQHGGGHSRALGDLRQALERVEPTVWREAAAVAAELESAAGMRAGLALVAGGGELADGLGLPHEASTVVRLLAADAPVTALGVHRLLAERGTRARLRFLARKLVPTPTFMRQWQPIASRGVTGLGVAYLWRPIWLVVKLPRGVVAWASIAFPAGRVGGGIGGAWWSLRAWRRCRGQLRGGGLQAVRLPRPPPARPGGLGGVERSLRLVRATCLERALVRQRWDIARGRPRDVVIGVRGPVAGFGAHAWLEGEPVDATVFRELSRWPAPRVR